MKHLAIDRTGRIEAGLGNAGILEQDVGFWTMPDDRELPGAAPERATYANRASAFNAGKKCVSRYCH